MEDFIPPTQSECGITRPAPKSVSFLLASAAVNSGQAVVNATEDFKDKVREELEEVFKRLLFLGLVGFGLYFALKKLLCRYRRLFGPE